MGVRQSWLDTKIDQFLDVGKTPDGRSGTQFHGLGKAAGFDACPPCGLADGYAPMVADDLFEP